MNKFTKEELSMMVDGIVLIKKQCIVNYNTQLKLDKLDEKLCSMINNYCEHVWTEGGGNHIYCGKCGIQGGKR